MVVMTAESWNVHISELLYLDLWLTVLAFPIRMQCNAMLSVFKIIRLSRPAVAADGHILGRIFAIRYCSLRLVALKKVQMAIDENDPAYRGYDSFLRGPSIELLQISEPQQHIATILRRLSMEEWHGRHPTPLTRRRPRHEYSITCQKFKAMSIRA